MRKTVNISKARTASRQNRAKKAVSVLKEQFEEDVKVSQELNEEIWSDGIENPPRKVTVELENNTLYPAESFESQTVEQSEEEVEEAEEETEEEASEEAETEDYTEVVDGTISDVKDAVTEMKNPDYEALLEAEKSGKDRKTLKEWLENRD